MVYRRNPIDKDELRRLAGLRYRAHAGSAGNALSPEVQHLVEELEIHKIELELQNEYLSLARVQLEQSLNQSQESYNFSPVGNLQLDASGNIEKMNLAAAKLLGEERARLRGSRFGLYVAEAERPAFNALLTQARAWGEVQGGEFQLRDQRFAELHVQIWITALAEDLGWQLVMVDITERIRTEGLLRANAERWRLALDAVGDGVWDWNVRSGEVIFSKPFAQLYGFVDRDYGRHLDDWLARIHPDDRPRVISDLQVYLSGKSGSFSNEHRGQCQDGGWKWVLARGAIVSQGEDAKALRVIGTHVDISGKKQAEEALLAAANFQQTVFDSLSEQVAVLDRHGVIVQVNAAWRLAAANNSGVDANGFLGGNYLALLDAISGQDREAVRAATEGIGLVASGAVTHFQLQNPFFSTREQRWFLIRVTPVRDIEERMVISHDDVSSLKAAELASWTLANIDALTGALSRRNFVHLAEQELERSTRYALPLMLLMLDLDHFKRINDKWGHAAGDAVLQGFVKTATGVLRESDLIGRIGGEEFAVLLPNTSLEGGRALAQRIIDSVRVSSVQVACATISYTVSIGAICSSKESTFATLLGLADSALYRAKGAGRDRLDVGPA
jgi:diguanylate cyclase (GGDEF)-like protein/PAS domain S-box-containing protein